MAQCEAMPTSLPRRPSGPARSTRFTIKSSHSNRFRLAVSHRTQEWTPATKDDAPERGGKRR
jgi:hypothetical protein